MIHGMVDRLAARLKQDGSDVDGWVRLVRAYKVLGETEKARAAAADAQQALAGDPGKLQQLDCGAQGTRADNAAAPAPARPVPAPRRCRRPPTAAGPPGRDDPKHGRAACRAA